MPKKKKLDWLEKPILPDKLPESEPVDLKNVQIGSLEYYTLEKHEKPIVHTNYALQSKYEYAFHLKYQQWMPSPDVKKNLIDKYKISPRTAWYYIAEADKIWNEIKPLDTTEIIKELSAKDDEVYREAMKDREYIAAIKAIEHKGKINGAEIQRTVNVNVDVNKTFDKLNNLSAEDRKKYLEMLRALKNNGNG